VALPSNQTCQARQTHPLAWKTPTCEASTSRFHAGHANSHQVTGAPLCTVPYGLVIFSHRLRRPDTLMADSTDHSTLYLHPWRRRPSHATPANQFPEPFAAVRPYTTSHFLTNSPRRATSSNFFFTRGCTHRWFFFQATAPLTRPKVSRGFSFFFHATTDTTSPALEGLTDAGQVLALRSFE
jgi:hypothetical protein